MVEVHVRHGQASAEAHWSLTAEGRRQAGAAAAYLKEHFPGGFDATIHSGLRRAVETARMVGSPDAIWIEDSRLIEADWGGQAEPRVFGPWQDMYARVAAACQDWDAEVSSRNRLVVSHGGTMRMVRAHREGLVGPRYPAMFEKPYKYFTNCQIVIYSRVDPATGVSNAAHQWVKSACPWNLNHCGHDWLLVR